MARRKRGGVKVDTRVEELKGEETLAHYNSVMLEDINSKMDLVLESVADFKRELSELNAKIDQVYDRLDRRFTTLELAFRALKEEMTGIERRLA